MTYKEAYSILGLEEGADRKAVKRAYAQKVKACHPEENPEGWKRLHDAYEAALGRAVGQGDERILPDMARSRKAQEEAVTESVGKQDLGAGSSGAAESSDSGGVEFDQISQFAQELRKERELETQELALRCEAVEELQGLFNRFAVNSRKLKTVPWEKFFTKKRYAPVFVLDSFLSMLGEMFDNRSVAKEWRDYFEQVIGRIDEMRMDAGIVSEGAEKEDAVTRLRNRLNAAYGRYVHERNEVMKQRKKAVAIWIFVLMFGFVKCAG